MAELSLNPPGSVVNPMGQDSDEKTLLAMPPKRNTQLTQAEGNELAALGGYDALQPAPEKHSDYTKAVASKLAGGIMPEVEPKPVTGPGQRAASLIQGLDKPPASIAKQVAQPEVKEAPPAAPMPTNKAPGMTLRETREAYKAEQARWAQLQDATIGPGRRGSIVKTPEQMTAEIVRLRENDTPEVQQAKIERQLQGEGGGVIGNGFRGLATGTLMLGESVGSILRYAGGEAGIEEVSALGLDIEKYFEPSIKHYIKQANLPDGNIIDKPELMMNPEWLSFQVGQILPSIVASLTPAGLTRGLVMKLGTRQLAKTAGTRAASKGAAKAAAKASPAKFAADGTASGFLRAGDKLIDVSNPATLLKVRRLGRAATAAAMGAGGLTGGMLEGSSTYKETYDLMLEKGASKEVAEEVAGDAFLMMTAASGVLNAIGLEKYLKVAKGVKARAVRGTIEAVTEWLEGPAEAMIQLGQETITPEQAMQKIKDEANVAPAAFIVGFLMPGAGAAFGGEFNERLNNDNPRTGADAAADAIDPNNTTPPVADTNSGPATTAASTYDTDTIRNQQKQEQEEEGEDVPSTGTLTGEVTEEDLAGGIPQATGTPGEATGPSPNDTKVEGNDIVEAPLNELSLSKDVEQIKEGADPETGVVEPLGGKYDRNGAGPIQIWVRSNGDKEIISGRHRADLAKRSGESTIRAQYYYEDDGFTAEDGQALDATLNIREGQGKVSDYVNYFKQNEITEKEATDEGLLERPTGKQAFTLSQSGGEETIASHRAGEISDEAAIRLSEAAPGDQALQNVGLQAMQEGKPIHIAENLMKAVGTMTGERGPATPDLFGKDDSAMLEATALAKEASKSQAEIQRKISAVSGASKRPGLAAAEGVTVSDPEGLKKRLTELKTEKDTYKNWHTNPELVAKLRQSAGLQSLTESETATTESPVDDQTGSLFGDPETEQQITDRLTDDRVRANTAAAEAQREKDLTDAEVGGFVLTGSDATADVATAGGQADLTNPGGKLQEQLDEKENKKNITKSIGHIDTMIAEVSSMKDRVDIDGAMRKELEGLRNGMQNTLDTGEGLADTPTEKQLLKTLNTLAGRVKKLPKSSSAASTPELDAKIAAKKDAYKTSGNYTKPFATLEDMPHVNPEHLEALREFAPNVEAVLLEEANKIRQDAVDEQVYDSEITSSMGSITGGMERYFKDKEAQIKGHKRGNVEKRDERIAQYEQQVSGLNEGTGGTPIPTTLPDFVALPGEDQTSMRSKQRQEAFTDPARWENAYAWLDQQPKSKVRAWNDIYNGADPSTDYDITEQALKDAGLTDDDRMGFAIHESFVGEFAKTIENKNLQGVNLNPNGFVPYKTEKQAQKALEKYEEAGWEVVPVTQSGVEGFGLKAPAPTAPTHGLKIEPTTKAGLKADASGALVMGDKGNKAPLYTKPSGYGDKNTIITQDKVEDIRKKLKDKLNRLNSGVDPEVMLLSMQMGAYHIEAGARKFAEFSKVMIDEFGDAVKPYLRMTYNGVRDYPGVDSKGMTPHGELDAAQAALDMELAAPAKTYEEFKKEYESFFRESNRYTADQAGMNHFAEKMADLADQYPAHLEQFEAEVDAAHEQGLKDKAEKATDIYSHLSGIEINNNNDLKKALEEYNGEKPTEKQIKEGQEAYESILVARGMEAVDGKNMEEGFNELLNRYNAQPNLNAQSSTSKMNQAFSTPLPLAWLASHAAGINGTTTVYEPSAGNGALLIGADLNNVQANELNPDRVALLAKLGIKATNENALMHFPNKVDSVITNPPFGAAPSPMITDGFTLSKIDHQLSAQALKAMKDNGRATLIIGANKAEGQISKQSRIFYNWLYRNYNVVDNVEVNGSLYTRQGAGWPVSVITIHGRKTSKNYSPKPGDITRLNDWSAVYDHFNELVGSERWNRGRGNQESADTETAGGRPRGPTGPTTARPDGATKSGSKQPGPKPAVRGTGEDGVSSGEQRGNGAGAELQQNTGQSDVPTEEKTNASAESGSNSGSAGNKRVGAGTNTAGKPGTRVNELNQSEAGSKHQTVYPAGSSGGNSGIVTPAGMADAYTVALERLKKNVGGDIDAYVMEKLGYTDEAEFHKAFMALQVDAIAATIWNFENGDTATIIADQTGVGKGRQAAAIIKYAFSQGKTPIFITAKANLFTDIYSDAAEIGEHNLLPFIMNGEGGFIKQGVKKLFRQVGKKRTAGIADLVQGKLPENSNMIMSTYSQFQREGTQRAAMTGFLNKHGDDVMFILDESHSVSGQQESMGTVNGEKAMVKSGAGHFMDYVSNGNVLYLSATYAKRPDNMAIYFRTSIMDAVDNASELIEAVQTGGEALQTVMSRMLARAGQLWRRERSFDGINMPTISPDKALTPKHEKLQDHATTGLRAIVKADNKFTLFIENNMAGVMDAINVDGGGELLNAGAAVDTQLQTGQFTSVVHNYVSQLLLGMKADWVVEEAIAAHGRGEKPIIAFENTMGSMIAKQVKEKELAIGERFEGDFRQVLLKALKNTRRVTIDRGDGSKNKDRVVIPVDVIELFSQAMAKEYRDAEAAIKALPLQDIPVNYIDYMRNKLTQAGINNGEITGRLHRVNYESGTPTLETRSKEDQDRLQVIEDFNTGSLDALFINAAGSTGLSIHASEKFKNKDGSPQAPRHMFVAQAMMDINTLMQMLGRINRTGQTELPLYSMMALNLPSEKRPWARANQKMRSLNANTSSDTESDTSLDAADILNKYGDEVIYDYVKENPTFADSLGVKRINDEDAANTTGKKKADNTQKNGYAKRITGKMALLPVAQQNAAYEEIEDAYADHIAYLNAVGQNDLVVKTLELDASIISSSVIYEGKKTDSEFGGDTVVHRVNVAQIGKPPTPKVVAKDIAKNLDGKTPEEVTEAIITQGESTTDYIDLLEAALAEADRSTEKGADNAQMVEKWISNYRKGETNTKRLLRDSFTIGQRVSLNINDDLVNAVVSKLTYKPNKEGKGNPWAQGKFKVEFKVNSPSNTVVLSMSKLMGGGIYQTNIRGTSTTETALARDFDAKTAASPREHRSIATGNLIMGFSKIGKGNLVNFTGKDGKIYEGILLPRSYNAIDELAQNTSPIIMRDAKPVVAYLKKASQDADLSRFGVMTANRTTRLVVERFGKVTITAPFKSDSEGNRIKFDTELLAITGDFYGRRGSSIMTATFEASKLEAAVTRILEILPLYAPHSGLALMDREAAVASSSFDGTSNTGNVYDSKTEGVTAPVEAKAPVVEAAQPSINSTVEFSTKEFTHTKTGETVYIAAPKKRTGPTEYKRQKYKAAEFGGWWNRWDSGKASRGFAFNTADARDKFIESFDNGATNETGTAKTTSTGQSGADQNAATPDSQATRNFTEQPTTPTASPTDATKSDPEGMNDVDFSGSFLEGLRSDDDIAVTVKATEPGMNVEGVSKHLARIIKRVASVLNVQIVQSQTQLPERVQRSIPDGGIIKGAHVANDGTVWLVTDNLANMADAEKVLIHEIFGHAAMKLLPNYAALRNKVQAMMKHTTIVPVVANLESRGVTDQAMPDEIIAYIAENAFTFKAQWKRLAGMIKAGLRAMGFKTTFTDADIVAAIYTGRANLQRRARNAATLGINTAAPGYGEALNSPEMAAVLAATTDSEKELALGALAENHSDILFSQSAGMTPEIDAQRDSIMGTPEREMNLRDRIRASVDSIKENAKANMTQGIIDAGNAIKVNEIAAHGALLDASVSASKSFDTLRNFSNVMGAVLKHGIPQYVKGQFVENLDNDSFTAAFEGLKAIPGASQLRNWEVWAVAVRAQRIRREDDLAGREGKQRREKLLSEDYIEEVLEWSRTQTLEDGRSYEDVYMEVNDKWQEFNKNLLDLAVERGVLSAKDVAIWHELDYVPFWREMEEMDRAGAGKGTSVEHTGIMSLRGGMDREGNALKLEGSIVESMFMNSSYLLERVYRNEAMKRIAADGVVAGTMTKLSMAAKKAITVSNEELVQGLFKAKLIEEDTYDEALIRFELMDEADQNKWRTFWTRVKPPGNDVVTVWYPASLDNDGKLVKGGPQYYAVTDKLTMRSLNSISSPQAGAMMTAMRTSKHWITIGVVADPAFMLANFMRDTISTWVVSKAPTVPILGAMKNLAEAYQENGGQLALAYAGRGGGGFYDSHPKEVAKLLKGLDVADPSAFAASVVSPRNLWRVWQKVGNASEYANRLDIYNSLLNVYDSRMAELIATGITGDQAHSQAMREGLASPAEAAFQAQDIMNFTRSGDYATIQSLIQVVPFMNARIQGLNRLYRGAKEDPKAFAAKGMILTALAMALAVANDDDDRYQELQEWDKDTYFHFWIGEEHFRLPKPFEVGVIFATIPERVYRAVKGDDSWSLLFNRMGHAGLETFAMNPTPQLFKPILEQYMNKSMFTGAPIVGSSQSRLSPEQQYDWRTGELARVIAEGMPDFAPDAMRSPKRIEHMLRGYFGALGMYAAGAGNVLTDTVLHGPSDTLGEIAATPLHELPVFKRFYRGDVNVSTKYSQQAWEMLKEGDTLARTIKQYAENGEGAKAIGLQRDNAAILGAMPHLRRVTKQISAINSQINELALNRAIAPDVRNARRAMLVEKRNRVAAQVEPLIEYF